MMLQSKIENFIKTSSNEELIKWINENPNLIYTSVEALFYRMSLINNHQTKEKTSDDWNILSKLIDALYINRNSVSEVEFNLLEEASSKYASDLPCIHEELEKNSNLFLFLLFLNQNDILNKIPNMDIMYSWTKILYQTIMDVYIPLENPELIIDIITKYYTFSDIIENAHNAAWFISIYEKYELNSAISISDILLVFRYISDIYTNRKSKLDFFFKLHRLIHGSYKYKEFFQNIETRYRKYFGNDTSYMMSELLDLITINIVDQQEPITKLMNKFAIDWSYKYESIASSTIMQCFIRDMCTLACFDTNYSVSNMANRTAYASTLISKMWGVSEFTQAELPTKPKEYDGEQPTSYLKSLTAMEAVHKDSPVMNDASKKIYKAYKSYKDAEEKVDSQITKACRGIKNVVTGDVRTEIIEGKKFSAIGLLKQILGTVGLFAFGPVKALIAIVIKYALKKSTTVSERKKIIMELEGELTMINEKIEDAKGDGNREAKYAMMRTKIELENALKRIKYGLEADQRSIDTAKSTINSIRGK